MMRAILFLVFNRLDTIEKVFEQIKIARPPRLYIASDGARKGVLDEDIAIDNVRKFILDNIDWPCEVKTKFNNKNLGCAVGVSSALDWFFENESDGIILEDDCVPSQSFFVYCEELLDYYKDNKEIWHISGYNYLKMEKLKESYYFSAVPHVWGWASWADRWKNFKFDLSDYDANNIKKLTSNRVFQKYWLDILNSVKENKVDSWAYRWFFTILDKNGVTIVPKLNMVQNIGNVGTHFSAGSARLFTKTYEFDDIIHPKNVVVKKQIMDRMFREWFFIDDRPVLMKKIQLFIKKKEWKKLWPAKK